LYPDRWLWHLQPAIHNPVRAASPHVNRPRQQRRTNEASCHPFETLSVQAFAIRDLIEKEKQLNDSAFVIAVRV
jgi:hypothetical protein